MLTAIPDTCDDGCPVARAAQILDGKWTTLILRDLLGGTRRYSELQRSVAGVSPRMLASRLAMLEDMGLISKRIYPTVPPKTEYTITALGREIEPVIAAMAVFGERLAGSARSGVQRSSGSPGSRSPANASARSRPRR